MKIWVPNQSKNGEWEDFQLYGFLTKYDDIRDPKKGYFTIEEDENLYVFKLQDWQIVEDHVVPSRVFDLIWDPKQAEDFARKNNLLRSRYHHYLTSGDRVHVEFLGVLDCDNDRLLPTITVKQAT